MSDNLIFSAGLDLARLWIIHKLRQYPNDSPIVAALEDISDDFRTGEVQKAHTHGELDDLYKEFGL